jgi:hypothetical protein
MRLSGRGLAYVDFRDAILASTDLRVVTIKGARLGGADLTGARWSEAARRLRSARATGYRGLRPGPGRSCAGKEPARLEDRPTA